jgi:hypothetical protein
MSEPTSSTGGAIAVAILLLSSACSSTKPCKAGTVLLSLTFDGTAASADAVNVDVSTAGGAIQSTPVNVPHGAAAGTIEIDFSSYPEGSRVDVTVTATLGGVPVGWGHNVLPVLPPGCGKLPVDVTGSPPDAAADAASVGGSGGGASGGASGNQGGAGSNGNAGSVTDGAVDTPYEAGSCLGTTCTEGQTTCTSTGVATCKRGGDGCLAYVVTTTCGPHQTCVTAAQGPKCQCNQDPMCSASGTTCASATKLVTCAQDAQQCVYMQSTAVCPSDKTCVQTPQTGGACTGPCGPGQKSCSVDNVAQACGPTGQPVPVTACGTAVCRRGSCLGTCVLRAPNPNDTIPFAVDSAFVAGEYYGDPNTATNTGYGGPCPVVGRSSATAVGSCWSVTYQPSAAIGSMGFAGVAWIYPDKNYATQSGYPIPSQARQVSFQARGAVGNEKVNFSAGQAAPPAGTVNCGDSFIVSIPVTLTAGWSKYVMPVPADATVGGVIDAFGWEANQTDNPGGPITFYIDDIRWE